MTSSFVAYIDESRNEGFTFWPADVTTLADSFPHLSAFGE